MYATSSEKDASSQRWLLQKLIETFGSNIHVITDSNRKLGTMLKRSDNKDDKVIHQLLYDESSKTEHTDYTTKLDDTATEPINNLQAYAKELRQKFYWNKNQK